MLVPRNYEDPAGPSIRISVIRLAARDPKARIGSLIINPGGPGASGIDFVREEGPQFSGDIRDHFDIVGFDPRGINQSSEIRCVDDLDHFLAIDSAPDTPAEKTLLLDGERTFVDGCQRRNGELLPYVGTANVVRDLDRLRAAVGDDKLTYLGFSYGTLIGALYADMFPDHVRALVLDGAVDPTLNLDGLLHGQARSFESALGRFLADCARRLACAFHHGGRPGPALDALMRRIEAKPLVARAIGDSRPVGPTYAWSAVAGALYSPHGWSILASALALADRGDGSLLLLLSDPLSGRRSDGSYSNLIDANRSVVCLDFPTARDPNDIAAKAKAWARDAPRFGALFAWDEVDCTLWPVPSDRVPAAIAGRGSPPIVVVGSTGDPATPYAWSQALARQLQSATLVTRRGEGHTGYFFSRCVASAADTYLIDLKVPKAGLTCS
jgi:pimeloyl-ACP methyl ester carboxylesterase